MYELNYIQDRLEDIDGITVNKLENMRDKDEGISVVVNNTTYKVYNTDKTERIWYQCYTKKEVKDTETKEFLNMIQELN